MVKGCFELELIVRILLPVLTFFVNAIFPKYCHADTSSKWNFGWSNETNTMSDGGD